MTTLFQSMNFVPIFTCFSRYKGWKFRPLEQSSTFESFPEHYGMFGKILERSGEFQILVEHSRIVECSVTFWTI